VNAARGLRIALVAGEASGDLLGADLVRDLRARWPDAQFAGIAGPRMIAAGVEAWQPSDALAVMGLVEVLRHLPRLLRVRREFVRRVLAWHPDVFIGIDAPDFNLPIERRFKAAGIRTVHYVSPSVWAWRESRAAKIGTSAERVLCLFPMEPAIYARHGVDARFVGHPLAQSFAREPDRAGARRALNLPADATVLALLPGSRLGEIRRLGTDFVAAARRVAAEVPSLHVIAPMANAACRAAFAPIAAEAGITVMLTDGRAHEAMIAADVVLLASGTAALEAMLAKRPMVVGYRLSSLTYALVRAFKLMKIDHYALPNVLAGEKLVPELMQDACTPENLAREVLAWLRHPERVAALLPRFTALHDALRGPDGAAANAILDLVPAASVRSAP
jgi:lipid-A-disaccharide synthase